MTEYEREMLSQIRAYLDDRKKETKDLKLLEQLVFWQAALNNVLDAWDRGVSGMRERREQR